VILLQYFIQSQRIHNVQIAIYLIKDETVSRMISIDSISCSSLMTNGGANRMMSPCVGLASKPRLRSRKHTSHASNPIEMIKPNRLVD